MASEAFVGFNVVAGLHETYTKVMVKVRFTTSEGERKALGLLARRYPFKTFADGYTLVPDGALSRLAVEGVAFTVEGRADYEHDISTVRAPSPSSI